MMIVDKTKPNMDDDGDNELPHETMTLAAKIEDFLLGNLAWSFFVVILTVWALYVDDIQAICLPKEVDAGFYIVTWLILFIFLSEFIILAIVQRGYLCSLQALMDLLAALSLVPVEKLLADLSDVSDKISVARVARATRAARILRSTRAAALALKAKKTMKRARKKQTGLLGSEVTSVLEDTLLNRTNVKMLLGILVLLLGTTLLSTTDTDRTAASGLAFIDVVYRENFLPNASAVGGEASWAEIWHDYRDQIAEAHVRELKYLKVFDVVYLNEDTSKFRSSELETFTIDGGHTEAEVSRKELAVRSAGYSMGVTTFAVLVILIWTSSFSKDHHRYVIQPVDRMIALLREMSQHPRLAMEKVDLVGTADAGNMTEIEQIEACIGRFGKLLKVGFGEAGMTVIARNLGGLRGFNPVVPGIIVKAVFGFCDIRNFTDCCEVLNEDTMVFTNRIADIVHDMVAQSGGSVNKNIGDAFLSVWKLMEQPDESNVKRFVHHLTGADDVVDDTLRSFTRMHQQLQENEKIQELCRDERLQKKLPGYTVRMGYGLHLGWAIEGAVGSEYKVDATYLSPNVNMASRLEGLTKLYGVTILMSNSVVDNLNTSFRTECRPIDHVILKGSTKPITLYCHMPTEAPLLNGELMLQFMTTWQQVFKLYKDGADWLHAVSLIQECLDILPSDTPSRVLLGVMNESGNKAPAQWTGYRPLR